jgi:methionyl-tRNA formyltransferase
VKKVLLFVNGHLGIRVIDFVNQQPRFEISGVVLNACEKRSPLLLQNLLIKYPTLKFFEFSKNLWSLTQLQDVIRNSDLAVSALFGHLIPVDVIEHFGFNIVNLHPSLLPIGRGSDPIAWAIIENQKQGVTIHVMERTLDSGPIISQSELEVTFNSTAGDIYDLAMEELLRLFKEFIQKWPTQIKYTPQEGPKSFHRTSELASLRSNLGHGSVELEHSLRVIQALTYSDGRGARLRLTNGELWEISLKAARVEE